MMLIFNAFLGRFLNLNTYKVKKRPCRKTTKHKLFKIKIIIELVYIRYYAVIISV
jgi:hypothetical protein